MSLFDEEEKLDLFDEDEKVRLFETYDRSPRSLKNYAKVILPLSYSLSWQPQLTMYLSLPGIGDEVEAPNLRDPVNQYRLTAAPQVDGAYLIATVDRMEQKDDERQCRVGIAGGND